MKAFARLRIRPRIDGTAKLLLYHLCWRHTDEANSARSSITALADDLDANRSTITDALNRLEESGLIRVTSGGGRGRTNRYELPWLRLARLDPKSREPVEITLRKGSGPPDCFKRSGPPDCLREKGSGPPAETVRPTGTETVRPTGPPKTKDCKDGRAGEHGEAEKKKTADQVFAEALARNCGGGHG